MLITRTKIRGFKAVTIKDISTRIATRHYFAYQGVEGREIKLITTKKTPSHDMRDWETLYQAYRDWENVS